MVWYVLNLECVAIFLCSSKFLLSLNLKYWFVNYLCNCRFKEKTLDSFATSACSMPRMTLIIISYIDTSRYTASALLLFKIINNFNDKASLICVI